MDTLLTSHKDQKTVREEIVAALRARGHALEDANVCRIDGCYAPWSVSEDRKTFYGLQQLRGRIRVFVGEPGDKTHFPEGKYGVNVSKVVAAIEALIARSNTAAEQARVRDARIAHNRPIVDSLNGDLPGQDSLASRKYSALRGHAGIDSSGRLCVAIERTCTEEQAREFLAACDRIFGYSSK